MPLTFGLTGMDPATESALKAAFTEANARLGNHWQFAPENEASHVVVDMDSMYGPMSWLRLHGAGKTVIGLTSAPRTQTDYRLNRPIETAAVAELLRQLSPVSAVPSAPAAHKSTPIAPAAIEPAPPHGLTPAPIPQDQLPEEQPLPVSEEIRPPTGPQTALASDGLPAPMPASTLAGSHAPQASPGTPSPPATPPVAATVSAPRTAAPAPAPVAPTPAPAAPAAAPARPRALADWLAPGLLRGRVRMLRNGASLLIDADERQYFGPALLKPLTAHVESAIETTDFTPVDAATWARETAALGAAQPFARLLWFGALLAGKGQLAPGYDREGRYRLLKWPQTEREFPKHFRIATAMMKGPATVTEITAASGVTQAEVVDFINASLATGYAELFHEPEPEIEPPKSGGLFGRLRGR